MRRHQGAKLRCAIYARHSTDMHNPTSSDDQREACIGLVDRLGGIVVATFTDPKISGDLRDRPGLIRLLDEVQSGRIDVIVSEALNRLARDPEDLSWIGKKLARDRVRLWTLTEGELDETRLPAVAPIGPMLLDNLHARSLAG